MVLRQIESLRKSNKKGLALLLDPDKLEGVYLEERLAFAKEFADFIFLGGSLTHEQAPNNFIDAIRKETGKPVILFPGNAMHVQNGVDAILFLSLLSGRNAEFLVGHHVASTPYLKKAEIEVIPTSYLLVNTGKVTTAEYISQTTAIPSEKPEITATTALTGQFLGKRLTYLDAGSGAASPVPPSHIEAVRKETDLPIIVGGGIRSAEQGELAFNAGADLIVIGNHLEKAPESGLELGLMVKSYRGD